MLGQDPPYLAINLQARGDLNAKSNGGAAPVHVAVINDQPKSLEDRTPQCTSDFSDSPQWFQAVSGSGALPLK